MTRGSSGWPRGLGPSAACGLGGGGALPLPVFAGARGSIECPGPQRATRPTHPRLRTRTRTWGGEQRGGAEAVGPSGVCPAGVSKPRDPIRLTPVGAGLKVAGHAGALAQIQRPLRDQGQPVRARRLRCLCGQPMAGGGRSEPSGARLRTTSPMSAVARPPGRDTRATQRTYRHTCSLCGYLPHTWPRHGCGPGAERRGHTSRVLTTEPSQPCRS